jgi:3-phosphoshikimate 1-carboxyvinyltransferase
VAACKEGAVFTNTERLRLKESDRVNAIIAMLSSLGCFAKSLDNKIIVSPGNINGGTVDSFNDHLIAMTAAIAATVANEPIMIKNAQCVRKSYPGFWDDYRTLGGKYEQFIRQDN